MSDAHAIVRLLPDEPFPPYSFVPGRFPHPESDPAGHSFGRHRPEAPALEPPRWADSRAYLRGLDLFNAGYWWESHVEFESLWIACGRKGVVAEFLLGLIKLAASGVKHREEKPQGMRSLATRAADHWREVIRQLGAEQECFLGLELAALIATAERVAREGWTEVAVLVPRP